MISAERKEQMRQEYLRTGSCNPRNAEEVRFLGQVGTEWHEEYAQRQKEEPPTLEKTSFATQPAPCKVVITAIDTDSNAPKKRLTFADILEKVDVTKERSIYIEELDGSVPYRDLTVEDFTAIYKSQDENPVELSIRAFWKAWNKADPTVTLEAVRTKIPLRIVLKFISEALPNLFRTGPLGTSFSPQLVEQSTS